MLPHGLLLLLLASLTPTQAQNVLQLDSVSEFSGNKLSSTPTFSFPSSSQLSVSIALCTNGTQTPTFFITNNTALDGSAVASGSGDDVWEIDVENGYGNWTGPALDGGLIVGNNLGSARFQIALSTEGELLHPTHTCSLLMAPSGPAHQHLHSLPHFGDTTSNEALLFSPPWDPPPLYQPSFPNYTLPPANLSFPDPTSAKARQNSSLFVFETSSFQASRLPMTACAIQNQTSVGQQQNPTTWLRDAQGWRTEWVLSGLEPLKNYTAFVVVNQTKLSGPINFVTKSGAPDRSSPVAPRSPPYSARFSCPLVHDLPYCPGVSWAVPIAQPPFPNLAHDASTLPSSISDPLLEYLTNFTTTLTTVACGRDIYSPRQTCADCQRAYRTWLCTVAFPRCSEEAPASSSSSPPPSSSTGAQGGAQQPFSALAPVSTAAPPRNALVPRFGAGYQQLLPCLETCNAADRACPSFLGFKCPVRRFGANESYGVGYIDNAEEGVEGGGMTGAAQDRWGNVWCNAG
jgi:calcium channel MID1